MSWPSTRCLAALTASPSFLQQNFKGRLRGQGAQFVKGMDLVLAHPHARPLTASAFLERIYCGCHSVPDIAAPHPQESEDDRKRRRFIASWKPSSKIAWPAFQEFGGAMMPSSLFCA